MIDVALTRAEQRLADVAVVIDVLRATSTIAQALAAGYEQVLCVDSVIGALRLRAPGRVLAGERRCVMPTGFDQGNSPLEAASCRGRELVMATTNGAPAIVAAARHAPSVILACSLNLEAVTADLAQAMDRSELDLQIVCAGTDGAPSLEDAYVAGRLCLALPGERTDGAQIAEAVARAYQTPLQALSDGAAATALQDAGLAGDIARCALESTLAVVPVVLSSADGFATVALRGLGQRNAMTPGATVSS